MTRRLQVLIGSGVLVLFAGYFLLPLVLEKWVWRETGPADFEWVRSHPFPRERSSEFASVLLWDAGPRDDPAWRKTKKVGRLAFTRTEVFAGDELIRRENIRGYLDAKVAAQEITSVAVIPASDAKWTDIFSVVDECRKSRVRLVLLSARPTENR